MIAVIICFFALLATMWAAHRSLAHGILALLSVGYCYGIVRANLPTAASHFIFDASIVGLYLNQQWKSRPSEELRSGDIRTWTMILIAWPCVMCLVPFQNFWVTLIGLRGSIFFLPMILLGSRLKNNDLRLLAHGVAVLNVIALGVAALEYFEGIERFFPRNDVTSIIFSSKDVAGSAFRIPSLFSSAHAYAGAMVMTLPLLFGAWVQREQQPSRRLLVILGMGAAIFGVLLAATRVNFVVTAILILVATLTSGLSAPKRIAWIGVLAVITVVTWGNERLQRFTTLQDTKMVNERINGSVNTSFWEILRNYPFGNGLGGGGTSMPYFLQNQVSDPVYMENEYARILAEQGAVGLAIWIVFIAWHLTRRSAFEKNPWRSGRRLAWYACTSYFGTALIGTGLLTAIPQTPMLLLCLGWISAGPAFESNLRRSQSGTLVGEPMSPESAMMV